MRAKILIDGFNRRGFSQAIKEHFQMIGSDADIQAALIYLVQAFGGAVGKRDETWWEGRGLKWVGLPFLLNRSERTVTSNIGGNSGNQRFRVSGLTTMARQNVEAFGHVHERFLLPFACLAFGTSSFFNDGAITVMQGNLRREV